VVCLEGAELAFARTGLARRWQEDPLSRSTDMAVKREVRAETLGALPWDSARTMLQEHMAHLCSEAAAVCVADYEDAEPAAVAALLERVGALIAATLEAVDVVSVLHCEGPAEAADPDAEMDGDRVSSIPVQDAEDIADAVMLARMGLRARQRSLQALGGRAAPVERLSAAGGALRTIQKSLSAVDRAMAGAEKVPVSIDFYGHAVERSLQIRRSYVSLHRAVAQQAPPRNGELRGRLRLAGNAMAQILGLGVAVHLRTGDRALLMMIHARVREWLARREDDAPHLDAGRRLWQDVLNTATMFLDVNRREELVQHDAQIVRDALHYLAAVGDLDEAGYRVLRERLSRIAGRSAVLDLLLTQPWVPDLAREVRFALEIVDRSLRAASGAPDDPAPVSGRWPVSRGATSQPEPLDFSDVAEELGLCPPTLRVGSV
jgi:hypothetical protein